ncbi:MAG TPA: cytochrome P450 [Chloroflexota bacterium]|nr:cytochrome P450 [Chloroflexota bacterium]
MAQPAKQDQLPPTLTAGATATSPVIPPATMRFAPYAYYTAMRRDRPVAHDDRYHLWSVYRYEDARRVLTDWQAFSSRRDILGLARRPGMEDLRRRQSLITVDPPRHRQLRDLVSRAFTPRAIANLEARITALTNQMLDAVVPTGRMDLIDDLAYPLPVTVIAEMLGVPSEDRPRFKRWSDQLVGAADDLYMEDAAVLAAASRRLREEMDTYFCDVIARRRAEPRDDLITGLVFAEVEGERLSDDDILAFCALLLVAGNITTTNLIGNAILCLLDHPEQQARVRADPTLVPTLVEEVLRYESPVQAVGRVAARDVELGGQTVPRGDLVLAWIGSANRDPAIFPDPDRFDVARTPNPHLAFGHGIHFCLGAPLARLEGRIALAILLDRLQDVQRADSGPLEPTKGFILHGVKHLPLRFRARSVAQAPGRER